MIRGIVAAALALTVPACVGASQDSAAERAWIVDGEITAEFNAVVAIAPQRIRCDDSPSVLCSGTLIAPDAVLTAAHCFASMRPGLAYEVSVENALAPNVGGIPVVEVITHPGFDAETRENDVAILWLARPVDGVSPEALPDPDSAGPEIDDDVELVGFGATRADAPPDGVKRVGLGRVAEVSTGVVNVDPNPSVSCMGDSGGPLFDASRQLIGVASSGDTGCRQTSVYALIAPTIAGFLEPALELGPSTRPPGLDSCGETCASDAECPVGFVCVPNLEDMTFHCALPGQEAGLRTNVCIDDSACRAGFCAVGETTPDCQCYEPCDSGQSGTPGNGCTVQHGTQGSAILWLLALGLWIASGCRARAMKSSGA